MCIILRFKRIVCGFISSIAWYECNEQTIAFGIERNMLQNSNITTTSTSIINHTQWYSGPAYNVWSNEGKSQRYVKIMFLFRNGAPLFLSLSLAVYGGAY